mmetsp:Transcript_4559/g.6977  ORF Transcript_4559/g.6977 Transcript_4559/m.6977 type:complete len:100 (-) Transcript_4559:370-669(-)
MNFTGVVRVEESDEASVIKHCLPQHTLSHFCNIKSLTLGLFSRKEQVRDVRCVIKIIVTQCEIINAFCRQRSAQHVHDGFRQFNFVNHHISKVDTRACS